MQPLRQFSWSKQAFRPLSQPLRFSQRFWPVSVIAFLLFLDQSTKNWVASLMKTSPEKVWTLFPNQDWLRVIYRENHGAFLSWGAEWPEQFRWSVLVGMNGLVLLGLAIYLFRKPAQSWWQQTGWSLFLAGGSGNLIDRVWHDGRVIDFLHLSWGSWSTGVFNLADVWLSAGTASLLGAYCWNSLFASSTDSAAETASPSRLPRLGIRGLGLLLIVLWLSDEVQADTVIYKAGQRGGKVVLKGDIIEFNQREMLFRMKAPDTMQQLTPEQIVHFEANYLKPHQEALQALEKGDFLSGRQLLDQALKMESRAWVRREILAALIETSVNQRDWSTAATHYLAMLESDPATRHQDLIPLQWQAQTLSVADQAFSQRELTSSKPHARLIAASWLLENPGNTAEARDVLNELLYSPHEMLRGLARCQLWRLRLQSEDLNDGEIVRWERQCEDLPRLVQAGPMFLLGKAYQKQVQPELAAARFLWLTVMDARNQPLTREATLLAAESLQALGQHPAAARIKSEAEQRFAAVAP